MASLTSAATNSIMGILTAPAGVDFVLNAVAQSFGNARPILLSSILSGNTPPELFEQSLALKYPTLTVYCDKLSNTLKEKFRIFSGTIHMVIEVRHSHDQIQHMQAVLESYVAAVCQVLDGFRGDLGDGLFYAGGYEVNFNPVKRGGRNFLQIARVALTLDVSV